jgi:hypothetical protein
VATVTNIQRPSTLASACASPAAAVLAARPYVAGRTAVWALAEVRYEKTILPVPDMPRTAGNSKINNSMGDTRAFGQGHTVDQIQGGSARGIPPRGRPV